MSIDFDSAALQTQHEEEEYDQEDYAREQEVWLLLCVAVQILFRYYLQRYLSTVSFSWAACFFPPFSSLIGIHVP